MRENQTMFRNNTKYLLLPQHFGHDLKSVALYHNAYLHEVHWQRQIAMGIRQYLRRRRDEELLHWHSVGRPTFANAGGCSIWTKPSTNYDERYLRFTLLCAKQYDLYSFQRKMQWFNSCDYSIKIFGPKNVIILVNFGWFYTMRFWVGLVICVLHFVTFYNLYAVTCIIFCLSINLPPKLYHIVRLIRFNLPIAHILTLTIKNDSNFKSFNCMLGANFRLREAFISHWDVASGHHIHWFYDRNFGWNSAKRAEPSKWSCVSAINIASPSSPTSSTGVYSAVQSPMNMIPI